ncbi:MAG TPA: BON domain-containing protein [Pyrinomonadaceae bacterium]
MSYDEEQARRSRVVVETPNERREVVQSQAVRTPDRSGISAGMIGVLVVVAIALITMLVLFWMSSQPTTDTANTPAAQQPTTIVQQPAQQPPVIIQQPAPVTTQPAPVIVTPPSGGTTSAPSTTDTQTAVNIDTKIQTEIDKRLTDDPTFSTLGITATVLDGKVTLLGTVKTQDLKDAAERMAKQIKGVKSVDNQITVL